MIVIGKQYTDGWGMAHLIAGETEISRDWVYSVQGTWFRKSDGRYIAFPLIDKSRPGLGRRHVPADRPTKWDLVIA